MPCQRPRLGGCHGDEFLLGLWTREGTGHEEGSPAGRLLPITPHGPRARPQATGRLGVDGLRLALPHVALPAPFRFSG